MADVINYTQKTESGEFKLDDLASHNDNPRQETVELKLMFIETFP